MICQLCGKQIGFFRRFVDREFCSAAHRHEARTCLDRTLADIEDDIDEPWAVTRSRKGRYSSPSAQTASVLLLVVAAVLILATLSFSGGTATSFAIAAPSTRPSGSGGMLTRVGDSIGRSIKGSTPATLTEDFHSGLTEWVGASASSIRSEMNEWTFNADGLKPGRLRIWKKSKELSNYELDFLGQIDRKSMGWAYRALDGGNYYGTKLTILKSGPGPNAGLVRYVMLNGRELDRVHLPLPINLTTGEPYRVRVKVRGDHFITSVNGQVISSWSDQRLRRGGVGFFTDEGESATVKWVSLSERDSLLGRVLAYFSLIRPPLIDEF
jgi:hypothetical protein